MRIDNRMAWIASTFKTNDEESLKDQAIRASRIYARRSFPENHMEMSLMTKILAGTVFNKELPGTYKLPRLVAILRSQEIQDGDAITTALGTCYLFY